MNYSEQLLTLSSNLNWHMTRATNQVLSVSDAPLTEQQQHMLRSLESISGYMGDDSPLETLYGCLSTENILGVFADFPIVIEQWMAFCNVIAQEVGQAPQYGLKQTVKSTSMSKEAYIDLGLKQRHITVRHGLKRWLFGEFRFNAPKRGAR